MIITETAITVMYVAIGLTFIFLIAAIAEVAYLSGLEKGTEETLEEILKMIPERDYQQFVVDCAWQEPEGETYE